MKNQSRFISPPPTARTKPVITGIGLVTPLGITAAATWDAILAGRHIHTHTRLDIPRGSDSSRVISLACQAADEAICHAGWAGDRDATAVVACTSKGSVESWLDPSSASNLQKIDNSTDPGFGLSDLSSAIARHVGAYSGARLTLSAACAGGLHGLIRGAMMIQSGEASRVLVVAAEASVNPLFLASFKRLGVLPTEGELCRPFDKKRSGFLMSEASAAVCLEAGGSDLGLIAIDGYAMGGDATHLTGSDPDGRVLRYLLNKVIPGGLVDLVHAHGTGTVANDCTELAAMEAALRTTKKPILFSHKGALGHSLGASGLVSVVLSCLTHQANVVPANVNTSDPIGVESLRLQNSAIETPINRSLIHAAGFGGTMAVVSLCAKPL